MTGDEQEPYDVSNSDSFEIDAAADDSAPADASSEPQSNEAQPVEAKRTKVGLLWMFVLATLAASAALGYFVHQLWQKTDQAAVSQTSQVEESQAEVGTIRNNIGGLEQELGALQGALQSQGEQSEALAEQTSGEISLLQKSLEKQSRHIKEIGSSNRDDWLIAEVEYLLRLANQRILMSKDSNGALVMLDSADRILHGIDDVSLHPVRKAIADDMAQLRAVEQADVDGAYLQLSALAEQVEELRMYDIPEFGLPEVDTEAVALDAEKSVSERASEALQAVGAAFQKAFVIRHDQEKVEAMLPPQDELYLRQNLRLMLEQAQMAMLSRRSTIYTSSLDKSQRWIAQYFQIEDSATQSALESLSGLATLNVDPALPDIAGSYRALKNYRQGEMNARPGLDYQPAVPDAVEPVEEPAATQAEPSASVTEAPAAANDESSAASEEPSVNEPAATNQDQPAVVEEPAVTTEPAQADEIPLAKTLPVEQPQVVVEEPGVIAEPAPSVVEPSAQVIEPSAQVIEPSAQITQPSASDAQPAEIVEEPAASTGSSITDELDAISIPNIGPGGFTAPDQAPEYEVITPQDSSATTQGADA